MVSIKGLSLGFVLLVITFSNKIFLQISKILFVRVSPCWTINKKFMTLGLSSVMNSSFDVSHSCDLVQNDGNHCSPNQWKFIYRFKSLSLQFVVKNNFSKHHTYYK